MLRGKYLVRRWQDIRCQRPVYTRILGDNTHHPQSGSQAGGRAIRRGEGGGWGGWERHLLPLWSPAGGDGIVFHQEVRHGTRTRATIKAHSTTLAPTESWACGLG